MRAGFSHLPVKHDLNKLNISANVARFSFLERVVVVVVVILYCLLFTS